MKKMDKQNNDGNEDSLKGEISRKTLPVTFSISIPPFRYLCQLSYTDAYTLLFKSLLTHLSRNDPLPSGLIKVRLHSTAHVLIRIMCIWIEPIQKILPDLFGKIDEVIVIRFDKENLGGEKLDTIQFI